MFFKVYKNGYILNYKMLKVLFKEYLLNFYIYIDWF